MKFGFIPLTVEVPSIDACFSHYWKLFLTSQEFFFFTRLHFVVPILSILSPDAFQNSSHVNTERSKQSYRVEYWRYQWQNLPLGYKGFQFLVGTSTHLKAIISTVHFCPSTEDPSVLGSTSTCFVLLIDFKSSGIASVTASSLLIHFFNSNPCCERKVVVDWRLQLLLRGFLLIWWNRPCRSCFVLPLLLLDTLLRCPVPLAWEHILQKLESS